MIPEIQEQLETEIQDQIDDYEDTIHAIIAFASLYFFDAEKREIRSDVKVFQGRRLVTCFNDKGAEGTQGEGIACPDLGIVIRDEFGILAEVKKNFPKDDDTRGKEIFIQLKRYDQKLTGWPTEDEQLDSHEIVLLVHLAVSPWAREFYEASVPKMGLTFSRPFSIVEFTRLPQRQEYLHLRLVIGRVTEIGAGKDLAHGIQVPMLALVQEYSEFKLYDAEPPRPYLLHVIWEHVLTPLAAEDLKFEKLRKNQKLEVNVRVEKIVDELCKGFSFYRWHTKYLDRQPEVPRREWIEKACDFLVESGEASWAPEQEHKELVVFYRKYSDVRDHFVKSCAQAEAERRLHPMLPGFREMESQADTQGREEG